MRKARSHLSTRYLAAPDGGIWKTTDSGALWRPLMDAFNGPLSATSVAVQKDVTGQQMDVVLAGGGDFDLVYWSLMPIAHNLTIHPTDPSYLLIANEGGVFQQVYTPKPYSSAHPDGEDQGWFAGICPRKVKADRAGLESGGCECYRIIRDEHDRLLPPVER